MATITNMVSRVEPDPGAVYVTNNEVITIRNPNTIDIVYDTSECTIRMIHVSGEVFANIKVDFDSDNNPCDLIINGMRHGIPQITAEERRSLSQNSMIYGTTPEELRDIV